MYGFKQVSCYMEGAVINTLVFKEDNKTFYYSIITVSTIKYDDNIHIQFYTNKDMYSVQIFFDEYKDFTLNPIIGS